MSKKEKGNGVPAGFAKVDVTVKPKSETTPAYSINSKTHAMLLNKPAAALIGSKTVNVYFNKDTNEVLLERNGDIPLNARTITIGKGPNKGEKRDAGVSLALGAIIKGYNIANTMKKHGVVKAHDMGAIIKIA